MAKLYFNNLHGSGAGKTGVRNGAATVTIAIEDDYSLVHVTEVTDAGVTTSYESPLYAAGGSPSIAAGIKIFTGAAANAAAAYAEVLTTGAIGSIYLSTAGLLFLQVANAGAGTDWKTVTIT